MSCSGFVRFLRLWKMSAPMLACVRAGGKGSQRRPRTRARVQRQQQQSAHHLGDDRPKLGPEGLVADGVLHRLRVGLGLVDDDGGRACPPHSPSAAGRHDHIVDLRVEEAVDHLLQTHPHRPRGGASACDCRNGDSQQVRRCSTMHAPARPPGSRSCSTRPGGTSSPGPGCRRRRRPRWSPRRC